MALTGDNLQLAREILDRFNDYYDALYDADGHDYIRHGFYDGFVNFGEQLIRDEPELIRELCMMRRDVFSSDRELAALAMTVCNLAHEQAA